MAADAATGGLVGALVGAGVSETEAHVYSESVRRGGTLVSVRVKDEDAGRVQAILATNQSTRWPGLPSIVRRLGHLRFRRLPVGRASRRSTGYVE